MDAFGKLFEGMYTGSMFGAGLSVFAVWPYCVSHAKPPYGHVELNPKFLAAILGCKEDDVVHAITYLCSPDLKSRSKKENGRRLIQEGEFLYRLVNFEEYREARDHEERKEYQREWARNKRKQANDVDKNVDKRRQNRPVSTKAEAEAEAEADKEDILSRNILNYLNEKTGKKFQPVNGSLKFIASRLREGATEDQCRAIIDSKCVSWLKDSKMRDYLRPQTLFNAEKFAAYVGELGSEQPKQNMKDEWESFGKKI